MNFEVQQFKFGKMLIAAKQAKLRSQIRTREIAQYKERVRRYLLKLEGSNVGFEEMELEYIPPRHHCDNSLSEMQKMAELIADFQQYAFSTNEQALNEDSSLLQTSRSASNSSSYYEQFSALPKNKLDFSLNDLELIISLCLEAERENHTLFFSSSECLVMIPSIFFLVMQKYIPDVIASESEGGKSKRQRLKKLWRVCQKILLDQLIAKSSQDNISQEEILFVTNNITQKIIFFHEYNLLSNPQLFERNKDYFSLIFDDKLLFSDEILHSRIKAAYLLIQKQEHSLDHQILLEFLDQNMVLLAVEIGTLQLSNFSIHELFIESVVYIFQILEVTSLKEYSERMNLIFAHLLQVSHAILCQLRSNRNVVNIDFIENLLKAIVKNNLYNDAFSNIVSEICMESVFANTGMESMELLAIYILSRVGNKGEQMLANLKIHYTFSMINSAREESESYDLRIKLIEKFIHSQ